MFFFFLFHSIATTLKCCLWFFHSIFFPCSCHWTYCKAIANHLKRFTIDFTFASVCSNAQIDTKLKHRDFIYKFTNQSKIDSMWCGCPLLSVFRCSLSSFVVWCYILMQIPMYAFYFSKVTWFSLSIYTDISSQVMWLYVSLLFLLSFQTKKKFLSKSC